MTESITPNTYPQIEMRSPWKLWVLCILTLGFYGFKWTGYLIQDLNRIRQKQVIDPSEPRMLQMYGMTRMLLGMGVWMATGFLSMLLAIFIEMIWQDSADIIIAIVVLPLIFAAMIFFMFMGFLFFRKVFSFYLRLGTELNDVLVEGGEKPFGKVVILLSVPQMLFLAMYQNSLNRLKERHQVADF